MFRVWREVERGCLSVRQVLVGVFVASPVVHGFRCPAVERLLHAVGEFVEVFLHRSRFQVMAPSSIVTSYDRPW